MRKFSEILSYPLRSGVTVAASQRGSGIRMLNMGELFRYPRIPAVNMARVAIDYSDEDRNLLKPGDLMFARRSLTSEGAGKCAIVHEVDEPTTWESSIIRARIDRSAAEPSFYFYYFSSPQGRRQIDTIVEQVAAAGIRLSELGKLHVPYPPLGTQRAIAEVLGALDDKIAANDRIVSLADKWVRASYRTLTGTSRPLGSIAANIREQVQPESLAADTIYLGLEHLPRRCMWNSEKGDSSTITSAKSRFQQEDVLFGKLRPYFHKVVQAGQPGICSTDILVIRPIRKDLGGLVLAACASDETVRASTAYSEGTRMPRTSWKYLKEVEVTWPGEDAAVKFSHEVSTMAARAHAANNESSTLAKTRDELLPLLMSGKIRVRDAERTVEEVV